MDMTGYLGKKVDIFCEDGKKYSGYVFDVLDADDSDSGVDCIELDPLEKECLIEIPSDEIIKVKIDTAFKEFDFRH